MYLGVYSVLEVIALLFFALLIWYGTHILVSLKDFIADLHLRHSFTTMIVKSGIKLHWITLTTVTS
jgi:ATP-binding cassette subfamily C (CFTR/MRP) protein 1